MILPLVLLSNTLNALPAETNEKLSFPGDFYPIYMQYSSIASCTVLWDSKKFSCGDRCSGRVKESTIVQTMYDKDTTAAAYIAIDTNLKKILAVFRGTTNIVAWLENIQIWQTEVDWGMEPPRFLDNLVGLPSNIKVHTGFSRSYFSIKDETMRTMIETVEKYPDYDIIFTGHSLGNSI